MANRPRIIRLPDPHDIYDARWARDLVKRLSLTLFSFDEELETVVGATNDDYDLASMLPGVTPTASEVVLDFVAPRTFDIDVSAGQAEATVAATGSTVFSVTKEAVQFATITFSAAGTVGIFADTGSPEVSVAIGERIQIVAPGTPDATLSGLAFTIKGTKA